MTFIFAIWIFLSYLQCTSSLRDLILSLPPAARLGETVLINCNYHLQGEELYTVKLYKGRHEFLQIVPDKTPPVKTFPRKGINIKDVSLDGNGKHIVGVNITLSDVNLFTTGLYGCEASADSSFHTQLVRKYLTVLVQPADRPEVIGFKNTYQVGEKLNMTCSLKNTFPSANITWFINGNRIDKKKGLGFIKFYSTSTAQNSGLITSTSVLSLHLQPMHFPNGRLTGKCVASILTMHWQSLDIDIKEEHPKAASVLSGDDDENKGVVEEDESGKISNSTIKRDETDELDETEDNHILVKVIDHHKNNSLRIGHHCCSLWILILSFLVQMLITNAS
ncbi:uncharacterized protein [Lepeophtheirus salmonis]|uniref:Ig-like domain-containing protein n=1 Tax=Lepeophtheirus salmonis TaxID=72036 RepID=A0A0K2U8Y0_LEPSM